MSELNPYEAPQSPLSKIENTTIAPPGTTNSRRTALVLFCCQLLAAILTWICAYLGILPLIELIAAATFLLLLVGLLIYSFYLPSPTLMAIESLFLTLTIMLAILIWEALGEL